MKITKLKSDTFCDKLERDVYHLGKNDDIDKITRVTIRFDHYGEVVLSYLNEIGSVRMFYFKKIAECINYMRKNNVASNFFNSTLHNKEFDSCPFCGKDGKMYDRFVRIGKFHKKAYFIKCQGCSLISPCFVDKNNLYEFWNSRII